MAKRLMFALACIGTLSIPARITTADALVGHWQFEGNLHDSAGTANGTFTGGPATYVEGMIGKAVSFDGVDDFVNLPSPANPAVYTIAVWVKPARKDVAGIVTRTDAAGPTTNWSHQLRVNASGTFHHYLWVGAERHVAGVTAIVPDTWYHVAIAAQSNGPMRLYVDGQEDATSISTAGTLWATGDRIHVGANSGHGMGWFRGLVDDLRIYDRELTATQITGLFSGIAPTFNKAENPDPPDGTVGVVAPLLRWSKGETAMFHNVYLGTSPDLTEADLKATRQPVTLYYHVPGLLPGTTYYWRVDEIEKDGITIHAGDVWSFVSQDVTAYYPSPVDGSNTVWPAPTLTWMPGMGAIKHQVYFSDNLDAVTQGAAEVDKGTQELANTAFAPGALEPLTTYYWRVDETIGGGTVKAGPVWSFTTVLPVDDFESYTDDEGSRIYETWIDGYTNGNSGSTVGYFSAPFTEQTIVHGGLQSMPLEYNNVDAPWYSEAERMFTATQDWTAGGVDTLVLYVRGRAGNAAAPLYVALQDAAQKVAAVTHPDLAVATATKWIEWKIPLANFAGVNPARIRTLYLGLGDRQNPQPGATGRIYIDDICLTRP